MNISRINDLTFVTVFLFVIWYFRFDNNYKW